MGAPALGFASGAEYWFPLPVGEGQGEGRAVRRGKAHAKRYPSRPVDRRAFGAATVFIRPHLWSPCAIRSSNGQQGSRNGR